MDVEFLDQLLTEDPDGRVRQHMEVRGAARHLAFAYDVFRAMFPIDVYHADLVFANRHEGRVVVLAHTALVGDEGEGGVVGEEQAGTFVGVDNLHGRIVHHLLHAHHQADGQTGRVGRGIILLVVLAVETVQAAFGTDPDIAVAVLMDVVYLSAREFGVEAQMVVGRQSVVGCRRSVVDDGLQGYQSQYRQDAIRYVAWCEPLVKANNG